MNNNPMHLHALGYSIIMTLGIVLAAGCGNTTLSQRKAVFLEDEYAPYAQSGDAQICGQALLQTQSENIKYGTGETIFVKPVTGYSSEWFHRQVGKGQPLESADPRAAQYQWTTIAGERGQFCIEGLPRGEYYVATYIPWKFVWLYDVYDAGKWIGVKTHVQSAQTVEVTLKKTLDFGGDEASASHASSSFPTETQD